MTAHRLFVVACAAGAAFAAVYLAWTSATLGGPHVTTTFNDLAQAVAAGFAAASAVLASRRSQGRVRRTWMLIAIGAGSWFAGEAAWTVLEVGLGMAAPFPSLADVGFLGAIPFFIGAAMSLPSAPRSLTARARALLDAMVLSGAAAFVTWAVWLRAVYEHNPDATLAAHIAGAYPIADLVTIGLLSFALGNATGRARAVVGCLLAAFAGFFVADTGFAYLELHGEYGFLGSTLDAGWVFGFELIALAALWPGSPIQDAAPEEKVKVWQLGVPWIGALTVIGTTAAAGVSGARPDPVIAVLGIAVAALFVASLGVAVIESIRLSERSHMAELAVAERTALLTQIISQAPLGIARMSDDLRFIDANPRLAEMLGLPVVALIGSRLTSYLDPAEVPGVDERLAKLRSGDVDRIEVDTEMRVSDGSKKWIHRSISTIRKPDGRVDYYLIMFEDLTDKHATEQAAAANLAASQRLNSLKSEFMSMVSHEFRTALTGIQGYSEIMSTQVVSPDEVKEFSTDINNDALRLNRMITEMLDLDRIESGRITLRTSTFDLNRLLQDAVDRAQATTKAHRISLTLDPRIERIEADSDRLIEVVSNLLSNAVKYSPNGGDIVVTSKLVDDDVEVSVRDHGRGIPPDFVGRIFGRYERYVRTGDKQVVGTGLGLAIARQLIELHKGKIWVDSVVGDGSEFHFRIPTRVAEQPQVEGDNAAHRVA